MHLRLVAQSTLTHVLLHTVRVLQHTRTVRITSRITVLPHQLQRRANVPRVTTIHQLVRPTIVTTLQRVLTVHQPLLFFIASLQQHLQTIHVTFTQSVQNAQTRHSTVRVTTMRLASWIGTKSTLVTLTSTSHHSLHNHSSTNTHTHPTSIPREANSTNDTSITHNNILVYHSLYSLIPFHHSSPIQVNLERTLLTLQRHEQCIQCITVNH